MGVKVKTVKDDFSSMERTIKDLSGKKLNVGVLEGESRWLAGIHEYGCTIKITPKMRAWLHRNGLHVKESTTQIVIPERSFLRSGFDEHHEDVLKNAERTLSLVLDGKMSTDQYMKNIGLLLSSKIKAYATALKDPPKHPFTLERHPGHSNPLVMSGDMIEGITWEVED